MQTVELIKNAAVLNAAKMNGELVFNKVYDFKLVTFKDYYGAKFALYVKDGKYTLSLSLIDRAQSSYVRASYKFGNDGNDLDTLQLSEGICVESVDVERLVYVALVYTILQHEGTSASEVSKLLQVINRNFGGLQIKGVVDANNQFGSVPSDIEEGTSYILNKKLLHYYHLEYMLGRLRGGKYFINVRFFDNVRSAVVAKNYDVSGLILYTDGAVKGYACSDVQQLVHVAFVIAMTAYEVKKGSALLSEVLPLTTTLKEVEVIK